MKEKWTNDMQRRMGNYEKKAPEGLLDGIKKEMIRRDINVMPAAKKKARVIPVWIVRSMEIAALLAIILLIGMRYFKGSNINDIADASQKPSSAMQASIKNRTGNNYEETEKPSSASNAMKAIAQDVSSFFHHRSSSSENQLLAQNQEVSPSILDNNKGTLNENTANELNENKITHNYSLPEHKRPETRPSYAPQYVYPSEHRNHSSLNVGIHYSGILANNSPASEGNYGNYLADVEGLPYGSNVAAAIVKEEKTNHHQPVKIGMEVRYNLDDRWGIQTGLAYSYLQSDFTKVSSSDKDITKQKLHYIGIPVNLIYNLYRNKYLNVYVTAGGEAEKMVKGKAETLSTQNGVLASNTEKNVKMNQLQFSTNAAAGVEYKVSDYFSIYAEPGVSYYFKNGSDVKTFYSDKPLGFSLNLGIRLNINQ